MNLCAIVPAIVSIIVTFLLYTWQCFSYVHWQWILIIHAGINIISLSEQFESNVVTVDFNVTTRDYSLDSYDVITTPPSALTMNDTRFQLQLLYNTVYNVTVIGISQVCRKNVTAFIDLHYGTFMDTHPVAVLDF